MNPAAPAGQRPRRVLAILGMHRSGTSALTGSLQAGGLSLGRHSTWNPNNLKGNRENPDVFRLHRDILKAHGGGWRHPRQAAAALAWQPEHYERARQILAEYAADGLWGFKDPSTLFLLDGWRQLVPDLEAVGIFRHPLAVAQSLKNRPNMAVELPEGLAIWLEHNRELLREHERKAFPLLCFDRGEEEFHRTLNRLHAELRLQPLAPEQRFYASELHTQRVAGQVELPAEVEALYQRLKQLEYRAA